MQIYSDQLRQAQKAQEIVDIINGADFSDNSQGYYEPLAGEQMGAAHWDKDVNAWVGGEATVGLHWVGGETTVYSSANTGGNLENSNNTLKHVADAIAVRADSHGVAFSLAKTLSKDAGIALKAFSRTGTVIGAVAGGGPALYNIFNGNGTTQDWTALGFSGAGLVAEFTGIGEIYDGSIGLGIAIGSLSYDVYILSTEKTHK